MHELNIKVRNKIAAQTGKAEYVCGNSDYIAVFDLDSEWDAYDTKTARFSYNGSYTNVVFDGNQCPVPVITDTHCFRIGVYAGDLHTTTAARVPCRKSILCGGGSHVAPSEDVYNQLMQRMSELETPDWNQNDSTKKDYIKNRTHWDETEPRLVDVLPLAPLSIHSGAFQLDDGVCLQDYYVCTALGETSSMTDFQVVFDDVVYDVQHQVQQEGDDTIFIVGNTGLISGSDNGDGLPFLILIFVRNSAAYYENCFYRGDVNTPHMISVNCLAKLCRPIDLKYLPLGLVQAVETVDGGFVPSGKTVYIPPKGRTFSGNPYNVVLPDNSLIPRVEGPFVASAGTGLLPVVTNSLSTLLPAQIGGMNIFNLDLSDYNVSNVADCVKNTPYNDRNQFTLSIGYKISKNQVYNPVFCMMMSNDPCSAASSWCCGGIAYKPNSGQLYGMRLVLEKDNTSFQLVIRRLL